MSMRFLCATKTPVIPSPTDNVAEDPLMEEARLVIALITLLLTEKSIFIYIFQISGIICGTLICHKKCFTYNFSWLKPKCTVYTTVQ